MYFFRYHLVDVPGRDMNNKNKKDKLKIKRN
jgi:hypothetical protein